MDDNQDLADSEALLLQIVGFEAVACYDGYSALNLIETFHPSICLIDLNMPRMNGDMLAKRLRQDTNHRTPVLVAVTARDDQESGRRIRNAGFDLHLIKPVDPNHLLEVIEKMRHTCRSEEAVTSKSIGGH